MAGEGSRKQPRLTLGGRGGDKDGGRRDKGKRKAPSTSTSQEEISEWTGWNEPHLENLVVPGYEHVKFVSQQQFDKFQALEVRRFLPTKYFCHDTLRQMNLFDSMEEFFANLHLSTLFRAYHGSFKDLTLEFLSSLHLGQNLLGRKAMVFRLRNKTFSATNEQLAEIFDLPTSEPEGRRQDQTTAPLEQMWRWMTGKPLIDTSHIHSSEVHHPLLRLFCKFSRESLFASANGHALRLVDLYLLAKFLNPNPNCDKYIPAALWKHLEMVGKGKSNQPICVGGLVTRIAERFGYRFEYRREPEALFDLNHLTRSLCIKFRRNDNDPIMWIVNSDLVYNLTLYADQLPDIIPKPRDPKEFLLEEEPEESEPEDFESPVTNTEGPSTSTFREPTTGEPSNQPPQTGHSMEQPQWFSDFSSGVMDSLGQMRLENQRFQEQIRSEVIGEMAQLRARQDHFFNDSIQALYPVYDYAYHHGWVRSHFTPPSWYVPPPNFDRPQYIFRNPGEGGSGDGSASPFGAPGGTQGNLGGDLTAQGGGGLGGGDGGGFDDVDISEVFKDDGC